MIYDCFPFFNELELLEIRLHELDPVVDRFVLVEATRTFQKQAKPLYYADNRERFSAFADKIIHIVVDKFPGFFSKFRVPTPWDYDNYQKDQVVKGLRGCAPEDVIIISDVDEIPRADRVAEYKDTPGTKVFQQRLFNYFLNCAAVQGPQARHLVEKNGFVYWRGSVMVDYRDFSSFKKVRMLRDRQGPGIHQIEEGGWHFSFIGDWQKIRYKLDAWAHAKEDKYNPDYLQDPARLQQIISQGEDLFGRDYRFDFIDIDASFPAYLQAHRERYAHLIK